MPATGILGYSDAYRRLIPLETLGAIVTNPITAHPRRGAASPRAVRIPGGLLMHTGLDNPGVASVIRRHHKRWEHSPAPVIAHVVGVNLFEAVACVEQLSEIELLAGVELGLPDSLMVDEVVEIVIATREACDLPLIVKLPLWRARDLADRITDLGRVDALTVAAPPRGTVRYQGHTVTGRLYGPATLPQVLWVLHQVAALVNGSVPLIGCGGIHSACDARALLGAGAVAVQVDSYVWKDPVGFARLARAVANPQTE